MSRTFRRKNTTNNGMWMDLEWFTSEHVRSVHGWLYINVPYPKSSKEYKKGKARFHSDGCTNTLKEPGPSYFRNLVEVRPLRRRSKILLHKFVTNGLEDVVIYKKLPLPYWT